MVLRKLALSLLGAVLAAPLAAAEPSPPTLRLPDAVRPTRASVELDIDPARAQFTGRIRLELEVRRPTDVVWLNAERLEIDSAVIGAGGRRLDARVRMAEQFAAFAVDEPLPAGAATLTVAFRGTLDDLETEGLFRQKDGERWYVYSQFESTYARRAFPCFDEPGYRLPWRLSLRVPSPLLAVSNTPPVAERDHGDGTKTVEFAETPAISSYLVALGVGPFGVVEAGRWGRVPTPVRIVVPAGREPMAKYAAEVTGELLARLEEYFDVPHPFAKLDNLAIPHTVGFGAMENPGLVTYSERLIAIDPAAAPIERLQRYASVAAHENAHQWFGNLVTMAWWDDIWLNEGFADWISDKIVAEWRPDWWSPGDRAARRGKAVGADSLPSARRVRRPISSLDDIYTAFDRISYTKGASLLEMFEAWMGPATFRRGIQRYVRAHSWGNATSDDLLAALAAEGGEEIAPAFRSFLDQPGAPVVGFELVCREGAKARLELDQHRYVPLGSAVSERALWSVPVRLRYGRSAGGEAESASARAMLQGERGAIDLPYCPDWISGNEEGVGYYLAAYRGPLLGRLGEQAERLPEAEQIALLADLAFLLGAGDVAPGQVLGLLPPFAASPYRRVVEAVAKIAESIDDSLVSAARRPHYERFLAALFGARVRALGLAPVPGESDDAGLLRPALVELLAVEGDDEALQSSARGLAERWLADHGAVAPDLVETVLRVAARGGDAALYDRFVAAAEAESDRRVRGLLLAALGEFREPALVERTLAMLLSRRFDARETGQTLQALSSDRLTRARTYDWVKSSYDRLIEQLPQRFASYLPFTGAGFCDAEKRADVATFFGPRVGALPGGEQMLEETLEYIEVCAARREAHAAGVEEFLDAY